MICLELGQKPKTKSERAKERTRRLICFDTNVWRVHKQAPHLCFPAAFSASCCRQYIVISRCTWVLDSQDSIVWSRRRKTNTLAAHLSGKVFAMSTSSVWLGFVLRGSCSSEQDPTCWTNNGAHHVSFISCSHCKKNKKRSWLLWSSPKYTFSCLSPVVFFFPIPCSRPPPHSCPCFALSCLKSRLSNYQRLACGAVTLDWVISTDCFPWESAE